MFMFTAGVVGILFVSFVFAEIRERVQSRRERW